MRNLQYLTICCALFWLSACSKQETPPSSSAKVDRPDMDYRDTLIAQSFDKGTPRWKLKARSLERWPKESGKIIAKAISLEVYDSLGRLDMQLHADSAYLWNDGQYVSAYGTVRARSTSHLELSCDTLRIDRPQNKVQTSSPIRVLTPEGDLLQGVGFESDVRMENWKILKRIKGMFHNPDKRLPADPLAPGTSGK